MRLGWLAFGLGFGVCASGRRVAGVTDRKYVTVSTILPKRVEVHRIMQDGVHQPYLRFMGGSKWAPRGPSGIV